MLGKEIEVTLSEGLSITEDNIKGIKQGYYSKKKILVYILSSDKTLKNTCIGTVIAIATVNSGEKRLILAKKTEPYYEPYIKRLIEECDGFYNAEYQCLYEKTCGSVIYKLEDNIRKYFLVENADSKHIGFPKGHIELNETELQTAKREVYEETALRVEPQDYFRTEYNFISPDGAKKYAVYFLAEYKGTPIVQESEISQSWSLSYEDAYEKLNYEQDRAILKEAEGFFNKKEIARLACEGLEKIYPDIECTLVYDKPYELMIAARLSAQCTDARVNIVTKKLFKKYPTLDSFANAKLEEMEQDIKPCGFFHTKAKSIIEMTRQLRDDFGGEIPKTIEELTTLSGIGRKTANLLIGDVWGKPAIVTDTHFIRITGRLGLTENTEPKKVEEDLIKLIPPEISSHFCHQVVQFGRDICKARKPLCNECPLKSFCMGMIK